MCVLAAQPSEMCVLAAQPFLKSGTTMMTCLPSGSRTLRSCPPLSPQLEACFPLIVLLCRPRGRPHGLWSAPKPQSLNHATPYLKRQTLRLLRYLSVSSSSRARTHPSHCIPMPPLLTQCKLVAQKRPVRKLSMTLPSCSSRHMGRTRTLDSMWELENCRTDDGDRQWPECLRRGYGLSFKFLYEFMQGVTDVP